MLFIAYLTSPEVDHLLSQYWRPEFLTLDGMQLLGEYRTAAAKWLIPRKLGINALCKKNIVIF